MTPRNPLESTLATVPTTAHTITVENRTTAVWEYGAPDAETTIVLIHGFRGTHHGLLSLVAAMPNTRFIAPDLPGFGASEPLMSRHTLASYARWLDGLLRQVDPDAKAVVLGHSFGSLVVANALESIAPRRIALVNPIAENALSGPNRILTGLATGYYKLGASLPERLGHRLLASPVITRIMSEVMAVTRDPALRRWIHNQHRQHFSSFVNRQVLLEAFRASVSDDVAAHAGDFPAGTLLVVGEKDAVAPLATSRRLHERMRGSELHIVHGVGHLIHYEAPRALARVLGNWCE